jgi:hypothetical protein
MFIYNMNQIHQIRIRKNIFLVKPPHVYILLIILFNIKDHNKYGLNSKYDIISEL